MYLPQFPPACTSCQQVVTIERNPYLAYSDNGDFLDVVRTVARLASDVSLSHFVKVFKDALL